MERYGYDLRDLVRALPFEDGAYQSGIAHVTIYRSTTETIAMPQTRNPYLYVVLDGTLRLHTPSGMMDYMAGQYAISQINTPISGAVTAFSA